MVEPRSATFRTPGPESVELHALHWGDPGRPALAFLHGGGANAHWWDHLAPRFADRYHVVALDFRGHGDSEYPEALVAGAFERDLEALVDHLDSPSLILAGHSMGGGVALAHAARRGGLNGLVLLDVARGGGRRSRRATRLALTLRRTYRSRQEAIDRYRFFPDAERADEALRVSIARASVRREPDGRYGFKFDPRWFTLPPGERPDPSRIACPTLLLRGAESPLLSREGALALCAELPDAALVDVPGAGHHVQIEQPDAVTRALDGFLSGVRGGA